MPGFSNGDSPFFCNDCVHRGCSCNYHQLDTSIYENGVERLGNDTMELPDGIINVDWKWVDDDTWVHIDESGREYPCCEYDYDEDGFEILRLSAASLRAKP